MTFSRTIKLLESSDLYGRDDVVVVSDVKNIIRKPPSFVLDLSGENISHHLFYSQPFDSGGIFKLNWRNTVFYGWHAFFFFLNEKNEAVFQSADRSDLRIDWHRANSGSNPKTVPSWSETKPYEIYFQNSIEELDLDLYFATPSEPLNWGMWLLYVLPAAHEYVEGDSSRYFGCWAKLGWQKKLLAHMGIPNDKIVQIDEWKTYKAKSLEFRAYPKKDLYVSRENRELFLSMASRSAASAARSFPKKIFISRLKISPPGTARRLRNEVELAAALERIGFTTLEPESLDFTDQMAAFYNADVVVGLGGAGMFNCVFCKEGVKIITIESSSAFILSHANMFASIGADYGVIFGERDRDDPRSPHHEWSIDIERAVTAISEFI